MLRKINISQIRRLYLYGDTMPFFCHTIFEFGKNANSIR